MKIKKINVLSIGKVACILYALFGLLVGACVTLASLMGVQVIKTEDGTTSPLGVGAVILFPILYAIGGFLSGILTSVFFNLASKWAGAIEIETE